MGKVLEILKSDKFELIRTQVNAFCDEMMADYLKECRDFCKKHSLSSLNTKNFYDSVWGTIEINEGEKLVLDSPILQRLRHIKQLGLADLLYASADHSRFSHTLGVIQAADQMYHQVEKDLSRKNVQTDKKYLQIIRLSAIFHDVGHMFCSHASERFFQKNGNFVLFYNIDALRNNIQSILQIKPSLSETLSVLIVHSDSIRNLLIEISKGLDSLDINNANIDEIIERICCFIWGYPYSEMMLPYSQIISGQVDADKIDYLKRDSHFTGVPAAVDMSRVFQKLRVVRSEAKINMKSTSDEDTDPRYTIAIAPAAINTVDQLIISRYMMFENVYFHQKTLTAETLLRYAIEGLCRSTEGLFDDFSNILKLQDNDIIHKDFDSVARKMFGNMKITDQTLYNKSCNILKDIAVRKLFKRSVAFTNENLVDVGYKGYEFYTKVFKNNDINEQEKFVSLIREQIDYCKQLLAETRYASKRETEVLLVVSPDISNVDMNSNLAIAEKNNKYRDMEFEADSWLKSRSSRKPQNYLITFPEDRYIGYAAAEHVLLKEYGLLIVDSIIYDPKDVGYIEQIKVALEKKGYYRDAYAIAPDDELKTYNRDIEELVQNNWKNYELISVDNGKPSQMDVHYLLTFIKQFYQFKDSIGDYSIFIKACIDMLKNVRVISKSDIFQALEHNFKEIISKECIDIERIKVCNVGSVLDGSAQITYQINSINEKFQSKLQVRTLEEALRFSEEGQIIVFIEDAFCSGKQIISVFQAYMGVPLEGRETQEEHVQELSDEYKEKLKRSKLYFSFIMYNDENESFFKDRMKELGLNDITIVSKEKFPNKYFEDNPVDGQEVLIRYLRAAGRKLLEQKATDYKGNMKVNWSEERISKSLLGYNDAQQLVVFAWNTPTYTITPLWMQEKIEGVDWIPLFPRINK